MISKERLQELIEQGKTIYEFKYGKINPVSLKNKIRFISKKYPVIVFEPRTDEKYQHHKYFDKLYETQAEAEWFAEFGCIERTERLELPTWEEFEKSNKLIRFISKKGNKCKLEGYYDDRINSGFIDVVCNGESQLMLSDYSKENYTIACRKCKELFLGEKI